MSLQAEDGTLLKAKEGVVLDGQGRRLTGLPFNKSSSFKILSNSVSLPGLAFGLAALAVFVPILLAAGFALAVGVGIILTVALVNRKLGRVFRPRSGRG